MLKKSLFYGLVFVIIYVYANNKSINDSNNNVSSHEINHENNIITNSSPKIDMEDTRDKTSSILELSEEENNKIFDSAPLDNRSPEFISPSTSTKSTQKPQQNLNIFEKKFVEVVSKFASTENGVKIIEKLLSPLILNDEINKNPYYSLSEEIVQEGNGRIAYCGDLVTTHFLLKNEHGLTITNTKQALPENIYIGFSSKNRGIDYSLIGMKEKSVKRRILSRSQMKEIKGPSVFFGLEIELLKINSPPPPLDPNQISIFDQNKVNSSSEPFRCGDNISIKYTIKNIRGETLYKTKEFLKFRIGEQNIPFILNLMTQGMFPSSKRTAIVPYNAYLSTKNSSIPSELNLIKKEELSIIEIETLHMQ